MKQQRTSNIKEHKHEQKRTQKEQKNQRRSREKTSLRGDPHVNKHLKRALGDAPMHGIARIVDNNEVPRFSSYCSKRETRNLTDVRRSSPIDYRFNFNRAENSASLSSPPPLRTP